ncbi:MAG: bepA 16, partial [Verrucomicrobiales bacterium]|nr:bepA 16 [Verrucomicrobiales bacterium]
QRFYCMRDGAREQRLEFLLRACDDKDADAALFVQVAQLYLQDARNRPKAAQWIHRTLRARPMDSGVIGLIADYLWQERDLDLATEHYRIAADIEGFRDNLYQAWFVACRRVRKTNEALEVLRERFERFGTRSDQPALTLAWAFDQLEQPAQARDVLTKAMQLRPDDAYLRSRAATQHARLNDYEGAHRLLESVRGKIRESDWLRTTAQIAEWRQDTAGALQLAKDLLVLEPLAMDARHAVARCTLQLHGPEAALAEVQKACEEFPHHCDLRRMLVQYSGRVSPEKVIEAARELLQMAPSDAWAIRELAVSLLNAKRFDEALVEARKAEAIEPNAAATYGILAQIHAQMGAVDEAIKFFRRAIEISVDYTRAIHQLVDLASTDSRRREQLAFIERELIRQVVTGEGLLAYVEVARPLVSSTELLNLLRRAKSERPDLWESWTALISELMRLGQLEEALKLARVAVERFAHVPGAWLDLSRVNGRLGNAIEEVTAAEQAFEMNPGWTRSALALANVLGRTKSLDDAKKIYLRALHHSPREALLHAELATVLWRQQQVEQAFCELERALRLSPELSQAWDRLLQWSRQVNQPERASKLAAAIAAERPGEMRNWLMLAHTMQGRWDRPERLQAIDRALALAPASLEIHDYKVELAARAGQFGYALTAADEGLAVVKVDRYALEARRAWVLAMEGDISDAIGAMRKVLTENAGYTWGWHQLITWLVNQRAWVDAEDAIDKLLKLQPRNTWVLRQLGHLQVQKDKLDVAQKTFKAVLAIDPTDQYSAEQLFNLQLDAGDESGAAETLALMRTHQPGGRMIADEIVLRLRKGEDNEALKLFEQLCTMPDADAEPVNAAFSALRKNRMTAHGMKIMKRVLRTQGCHRKLGVVLMNHYVLNHEHFRAAYQLERIADSEVKREAANLLADSVGKKTSPTVLRMVVSYCRATFLSSDEAWGHVGYGLASWHKHRATVSWLSDWEGRKEVEPWMLFNLCLALRQRGKYEECVRVSNHILQRWPHHDGSNDVQMFLAIESAINLHVDAAAKHLAKAKQRRDLRYDELLILMARTLVIFLQTPESERSKSSWTACQGLSELPWSPSGQSWDLRHTFKRVARVIGRNGGGMRARSWLFLRLHWLWLLPTTVVLLFYILIMLASGV